MPRGMLLAAVAGVLVAAGGTAAAQVDRYDRPNDRPPYDRRLDTPADRADERPYDRPSDYRPEDRTGEGAPVGVYEGMRVGAKERRQGNVTFITGGVTKDEAEAFRAAMGRYALSLEFARANAPRGDFLAGVDVSVTDANGRPVLETIADGPFVLANVPPGNYTVRASSQGQVKTKTVNIGAGQNRHLVFTW